MCHSCVVGNEHLELLKIFRLVLMKLYIQQLSGDIHEEVDTHNRMLDRMVSPLQLCNLPQVFIFVVCLKIRVSFSCLAVQGNDMDSSRGVLSGTMDKFKMVCNLYSNFALALTCKLNLKLFPCLFQVFETKSSQRMFTLVASFVVLFLVVYYLTR